MKMPVSVKKDEYLKVKNLRDSSVNIFNRGFKWFIELFGDIDVTEVRFGHCDDFKSWLLKGRSESSANAYLRIMRPFWGWLFRRGWIKSSPMEGISLYKVNEKTFDTYSLEDVRAVLGFECSNALYRQAFCLGLSGMRESEILNLTISEIDIENSRIKVTPKKETAETWGWQIKDNQERYIGIHESVLNMLIKRISEIDFPYVSISRQQWQKNIKARNAGMITHDRRLRPWRAFPRDFKNFLERAGIKPKRFHDSRSTFARNLIESPEIFDIEMVREAMGHASIRTTQVYLSRINKEKLAVKSSMVFGKCYVS